MNLKKMIASMAISLAALAILVANFSNEKPAAVNLVDVKYSSLSKKTQKQIDCLAQNIYHEARGESEAGQLAVAMVTMNRVGSGNFPDSVCGVVYQKTGRTYQFSWVSNKKKLTTINHLLYNDIVELATMIYFNHGRLDDMTDGATFYHADYVNPKWKGLEKTNQIGHHIFYKVQDI